MTCIGDGRNCSRQTIIFALVKILEGEFFICKQTALFGSQNLNRLIPSE